MDQKEIKFLFQRYIDGEISDEEMLKLRSVLIDSDREDEIAELLDAAWDNHDHTEEQDISRQRAEEIFQAIISKKKRRRTNESWFRVAALITVVIAVGLGLRAFYSQQESPSEEKKQQTLPEEILPGNSKAVLTLSDGTEILLNDKSNGHLATQGNVEVRKAGHGQLVYSVKADGQIRENQFNTISTPRGGEYQVTLPDGSKVWLNAQSSLRYPTYFSGKERVVEMVGEAYFEVAKNKAMPFKVLSNAVEVKVLGTHFNVMAYPDEKHVKTTLLEGSVSINQQLLSPGQQAEVDKASRRLSIAAVNTEEVIAWKNGLFIFRNESIQSIMKKVGRWYDADIEFKDKSIMDKKFGGTFSRFDHVSDMLHTMELTGVIHFEIKGRRIIVMK